MFLLQLRLHCTCALLVRKRDDSGCWRYMHIYYNDGEAMAASMLVQLNVSTSSERES